MNEKYWNESPENQAKLIASEGDYDYEHALRWVLGGVILRNYERTNKKLIATREPEIYPTSSIRVSERVGSNRNS